MPSGEQPPGLLAVCIPTFERPEFIRHQIAAFCPILKKHGVPLYVSDNSRGNETRAIVESFAHEFSIFYSQNEENIHDRNFVKAVSLPTTRYRWLLSDSSLFDEARLLEVLEICAKGEFAYVLVNNGKVQDDFNGEISDPVVLLETLGWSLTLISSFVFAKEVVDQAQNLQRYFHGNFIHHAMLFELLPFHSWRVYWMGTFRLKAVPLTKTNTWTSITYDLWTKRWTEHILSLPDCYPLVAKLRCIRDHGTKSGVFGFERIARQRSVGALDTSVLSRYRNYLRFTVRHRIWLSLMAVAPRWLAALSAFALHKAEKLGLRIRSLVRPGDQK